MTGKRKSQAQKPGARRRKALRSGQIAKKASAKALGVAADSTQQTEHSEQTDWIELFPFSISVTSALGRPVLIMKDKSEEHILPVWMNPLDAGLALGELSQAVVNSPHVVSRRILEVLELKIESCSFEELVGHHQFVQLVLSGPSGARTLRVRADEAMSFCIQCRARFFSTKAFMERSRRLDDEMMQLEQNLAQGKTVDMQSDSAMENSSKKHPYVM